MLANLFDWPHVANAFSDVAKIYKGGKSVFIRHYCGKLLLNENHEFIILLVLSHNLNHNNLGIMESHSLPEYF